MYGYDQRPIATSLQDQRKGYYYPELTINGFAKYRWGEPKRRTRKIGKGHGEEAGKKMAAEFAQKKL